MKTTITVWQIVALVALALLNPLFMWALYLLPGASWATMIPSTLWSWYIVYKYLPFAEIWWRITKQENANEHPL